MNAGVAAGFGVIGLGSMGLGAALSARRQGLAVWGVDPLPANGERLAAAGGQVVATAAALAAHCGVVQVLVVNAAQTEAVLFGADGLADALPAGAVVLVSATVDPALPPKWEARLAERSILFIDAPVSGGAQKAAVGQMTVMASGAAAAFDAAAPRSGLPRTRAASITCATASATAGLPGRRQAMADRAFANFAAHFAGRPLLPPVPECRGTA